MCYLYKFISSVAYIVAEKDIFSLSSFEFSWEHEYVTVCLLFLDFISFVVME